MRDLINSLEEGFIRLLLVGMTLLVFVEVVLRFGFNTGIHWAQEVTLLMSAWFVLFGVSYGIKVGAHIGVDAFVKLLPETPRRVAAIIAVVLCLFYCGLFLYGGWVYLSKLHMIGIELEDLPYPKWIATSILFIGFVLLAMRFLHLLWKLMIGQAEGFKLADEAKESMHLADEVAAHDNTLSQSTSEQREK
ncbi:TRAP transporter small permease [Aestuariirhabdus sp. Z084]|uniref:TRAP transporter small permease n=1 Tax=Aestuariirhabdus haliotis TaxID=2918751 RepID=UPI00201B3D63|nr:TRAP transporter small permease [Aestuariirhabdus haliotis]MCL6415897.1 TRAP transporter small permease [Aestuariirhabdus haliotis]MCL6419895.1 TRAP transporter small permease [Aestuariirhabdus haliotis]